MMSEQKILIIDDDTELCELIKLTMEHQGFQVDLAYDGSTGLKLSRENVYQTVILDIMLPQMDGWEVCQKLRSSSCNSKVPVIMLTAKVEEDDKIMGLKLGADDYVTKPFSPRELLARVQALIRREYNFNNQGQVFKEGDLTINVGSYQAYINQHEIELTRKEFEVLNILVQTSDKVFTRQDLLEKIWGFSFTGGTRTVDEHIKRLRKKLENRSDFTYIKTVWGVGYKFEVKQKDDPKINS